MVMPWIPLILLVVSCAMLAYIYVGYAVVVRCLAALFPRPVRRATGHPDTTVVVTAYNEEKGIVGKLENLVALEYPSDRLEIIVVSDASSDRTDELVRDFDHPAVRLLRVEGRVGKTACQNAAAREARGEIIVFTDATTRVDGGALEALASNFGDESVGCVAGLLSYLSASESVTAQGGKSYWGYELGLRRAESRLHSLVGVSGCLYAVRRSAYRDIPADLISDFVIAMVMQEQGLRTVLEIDAKCFEEVLTESDQELSMRVRVALRSIHALWTCRRYMNPLRHGVFAWELVSHKLLRYLSPIFIVTAFLATGLLSAWRPSFVPLLLLETAMLLLAGMGYFVPRGILVKLYYFLLTNVASVIALIKYLRGERIVTWKPLR